MGKLPLKCDLKKSAFSLFLLGARVLAVDFGEAFWHTHSKTPVSSLTLRKPPPPIQDFSCRELPAWWSKKLAVRAKGFIPKHRAGLHKVTTVGLKALTAAHIFWLNPEQSKKEPRGSQVAAASQQSTVSQRGGGSRLQTAFSIST